MRRGIRWTVVGLALVVGTAACGNGEGGEGTPSPGSRFPTVWLAVFESTADPNEPGFEERGQEVKERAGRAISISPEGCFVDLPDEVAPAGGYVLAVRGESEEEMAAAVDRVGREPIFAGQVQDMCVE